MVQVGKRTSLGGMDLVQKESPQTEFQRVKPVCWSEVKLDDRIETFDQNSHDGDQTVGRQNRSLYSL